MLSLNNHENGIIENNINNEIDLSQYNGMNSMQNTGGPMTNEIDSINQGSNGIGSSFNGMDLMSNGLGTANNRISNSIGGLMTGEGSRLMSIGNMPNIGSNYFSSIYGPESNFPMNSNNGELENAGNNFGNVEQPYARSNIFNQIGGNYGSMMNNIQPQISDINSDNNFPQTMNYGNNGVDNENMYRNNMANTDLFNGYYSGNNYGTNLNNLYNRGSNGENENNYGINNMPFMPNLNTQKNDCNSMYCPSMPNNNLNNNEDFNGNNYGFVYNNKINAGNEMNQNIMGMPQSYNTGDQFDLSLKNNQIMPLNNGQENYGLSANKLPMIQQEKFNNVNGNTMLRGYSGNINRPMPDFTNNINKGNDNSIPEHTGSMINNNNAGSGSQNNFINNQMNGKEDVFRSNFISSYNNNFQQQNGNNDININKNDIDYYDIPNDNSNNINSNNFNQQNMQKYAEYLELINKKYGVEMPNKNDNRNMNNNGNNFNNKNNMENFGSSINSVISSGGVKIPNDQQNNNRNENQQNSGGIGSNMNNNQTPDKVDSFNKKQEKTGCEDVQPSSSGYGSFQETSIRSYKNFNNVENEPEKSIYSSNNGANIEYTGCQNPPMFNNFNNNAETVDLSLNNNANVMPNIKNIVLSSNTLKPLDIDEENKSQQQFTRLQTTSVQALTRQVFF